MEMEVDVSIRHTLKDKKRNKERIDSLYSDGKNHWRSSICMKMNHKSLTNVIAAGRGPLGLGVLWGRVVL